MCSKKHGQQNGVRELEKSSFYFSYLKTMKPNILYTVYLGLLYLGTKALHKTGRLIFEAEL